MITTWTRSSWSGSSASTTGRRGYLTTRSSSWATPSNTRRLCWHSLLTSSAQSSLLKLSLANAWRSRSQQHTSGTYQDISSMHAQSQSKSAPTTSRSLTAREKKSSERSYKMTWLPRNEKNWKEELLWSRNSKLRPSPNLIRPNQMRSWEEPTCCILLASCSWELESTAC